jgi:hypothetical protein
MGKVARAFSYYPDSAAREYHGTHGNQRLDVVGNGWIGHAKGEGQGRNGGESEKKVTSKLDMRRLVPVDQMTGEDKRETALLTELLRKARDYLTAMPWCRGIRREFYGLGVGGVVGVFLFEILAKKGVDSPLWVICGDLPSAYLVTEQAPTPTAALRLYCELMSDWIVAVRKGGDLSEVFPVPVAPTKEHAKQLETRIKLLRTKIIPAFECP